MFREWEFVSPFSILPGAVYKLGRESGANCLPFCAERTLRQRAVIRVHKSEFEASAVQSPSLSPRVPVPVQVHV